MEALTTMTRLEGGRFQDENGMILPWYTSPCLEWLLTLDFNMKHVFEFGMGDSTFWYTKQGAIVHGVDDNPVWAVGGRYVTEKTDYINAIYDTGLMYDFIIIDGLYRDECTAPAINCLKRGGYIIIDNFKQPSVQADWPLTDYFINEILIKIYKEPDHYDWQTAVIQL